MCGFRGSNALPFNSGGRLTEPARFADVGVEESGWKGFESLEIEPVEHQSPFLYVVSSISHSMIVNHCIKRRSDDRKRAFYPFWVEILSWPMGAGFLFLSNGPQSHCLLNALSSEQ